MPSFKGWMLGTHVGHRITISPSGRIRREDGFPDDEKIDPTGDD